MSGIRRNVAEAASLALAMVRRRLPQPQGFRVLMYHAIGTSIPEDRLGIYSLAPSDFGQQMESLSVKSPGPVAHFLDAIKNKTGVAITFDDGYSDVLRVAAPVLAGFGFPFTVFVTTGYVLSGDRIYLSPTELRELAKIPGATVGSHGVSHCKLTECTNAQLREELLSSKGYLEDILQCTVNTLSYPHGAVDERVIDVAKNAGYVLAACSKFGTNLSDRNLFKINRTDIWSGDGVSQFNAKLGGGWDWMRWRT